MPNIIFRFLDFHPKLLILREIQIEPGAMKIYKALES